MGGIYKERKAVVVFWDKGEYEGPVHLATSNLADLSDISGTNLDSNQGYAALTYPLDYVGGTHVVVSGGDEVLDEFDIDV
jgi:hypothetical protein